MKYLKLALLCLIPILQNCGAKATFSSASSTEEIRNLDLPEVPAATPGEKLSSLSHSPNAKQFSVSWSGVSGDSNCVIQVKVGDWVNLETVGCESGTRSIELPSHPGLWSEGRVRLASLSGEEILIFSESLSCVSREGSASPTPSLDENCDGRFDDSQTGFNICGPPQITGQFLAGQSYSVPPTMPCQGHTATLESIYFGIENNEGLRFKDSQCQIVEDIYMGHGVYIGLHGDVSPSGTVPQDTYGNINSAGCQAEGPGGPRHVKYNQAGWTVMKIHYKFNGTVYF